jgi:hypothetical protein
VGRGQTNKGPEGRWRKKVGDRLCAWHSLRKGLRDKMVFEPRLTIVGVHVFQEEGAK